MVTTGNGLHGRVALVTGASSGLGRATALAMARAGADVGLMARSTEDLQRVSQEVGQAGRRALVEPVDLVDAAATAAAAERLIAGLGGVDVLINAGGTDAPGPVEALGVEDWDRVLGVNLRAPFVLSKAVFPHLRAAGSGTIVNVSSVAGKRGWADAAAYCSSKFALTGFTQALAAEGEPHGIRACVVYPGAMATDWGTWSPDERRAQRSRDEPDDAPSPDTALPPTDVADLLVWIVTAPSAVVLDEVVVAPLHETHWP